MTETTHFGARQVPLEDKQDLVDDVFHSVAQPLRPDERPDVARAASGLEGCAGHRDQSAEEPAVRAARYCRRHRRRRLARHRAPAAPTPAPYGLRHQCRDARGRPRARRGTRCSTMSSPSPKPMPKRCRLPIAASTPRPSRSASATCRASSVRSPRLIACSRSADDSAASNSPPSMCPGFDGSTTFIPSTSFPRWAARSPATPNPIAIWWNRSAASRSRRTSPP